MGLFGKSTKQKTLEELADCIGTVNRYWRQLSQHLKENGGVSAETVRLLNEQSAGLTSAMQRMTSLYNSLSDEDKMKVTVADIDGGYIPYAFWLMHFQRFMNDVERQMDKYYGINL